MYLYNLQCIYVWIACFEDVMVLCAPCFQAIHIPKGYGDKQLLSKLLTQMVTSGHSLDETRERVWPTSDSGMVHYG